MKAAYMKSGVNGTAPIKGLTDIEQKVLSIISDAAVDGDGTTRECGRAIPTVSRPLKICILTLFRCLFYIVVLLSRNLLLLCLSIVTRG